MPSRSRDGTLGFGAPSVLRILCFSLGFMFFPYGFPSEFRATLFFLFLNFGDFGKLFRAIVEIVLASPGPGVAGNGFSAKKDGQFKGRG